MTDKREPRVLSMTEIDAAQERIEQHLAVPTFAVCEVATLALDLLATLRDQCAKTTEAEQVVAVRAELMSRGYLLTGQPIVAGVKLALDELHARRQGDTALLVREREIKEILIPYLGVVESGELVSKVEHVVRCWQDGGEALNRERGIVSAVVAILHTEGIKEGDYDDEHVAESVRRGVERLAEKYKAEYAYNQRLIHSLSGLTARKDALEKVNTDAREYVYSLGRILELDLEDERLYDNIKAHVVSLVSDRNQAQGEVERMARLMSRVGNFLSIRPPRDYETDEQFVRQAEAIGTKLSLWRAERQRLFSYLEAEYGSSVSLDTESMFEATWRVLNYWQQYGKDVAGQICTKLDEMMIDGDGLYERFLRVCDLLQEAETAKDDLSKLRRDLGDAVGCANPTNDEALISAASRAHKSFVEAQENLTTEVEHSNSQEKILHTVQAIVNKAGVKCLGDFLVPFGVDTLVAQRDELRAKMRAAHEALTAGFGSSGVVDKKLSLVERIKGATKMHGIAHESTEQVANVMLRQFETWGSFQRRVGELRGERFNSPREVLPYVEGMFAVLKAAHNILDMFGIAREPSSLLTRIEALGKLPNKHGEEVARAHVAVSRINPNIESDNLVARIEMLGEMVKSPTCAECAEVRKALDDAQVTKASTLAGRVRELTVERNAARGAYQHQLDELKKVNEALGFKDDPRAMTALAIIGSVRLSINNRGERLDAAVSKIVGELKEARALAHGLNEDLDRLAQDGLLLTVDQLAEALKDWRSARRALKVAGMYGGENLTAAVRELGKRLVNTESRVTDHRQYVAAIAGALGVSDKDDLISAAGSIRQSRRELTQALKRIKHALKAVNWRESRVDITTADAAVEFVEFVTRKLQALDDAFGFGRNLDNDLVGALNDISAREARTTFMLNQFEAASFPMYQTAKEAFFHGRDIGISGIYDDADSAAERFDDWYKTRTLGTDRPKIVTLCGSTRFKDKFVEKQFDETLAGNIVLTIGCDMRTDDDLFGRVSPEQAAETKRQLDALHLKKIELSDEVLILNVGGYIGASTRNELRHALKLKKVVRFLEPDKVNNIIEEVQR